LVTTLSLLLAFNGLSTQEGIICILGSKITLLLYHYDEGAFNLDIEKILRWFSEESKKQMLVLGR